MSGTEVLGGLADNLTVAGALKLWRGTGSSLLSLIRSIVYSHLHISEVFASLQFLKVDFLQSS